MRPHLTRWLLGLVIVSLVLAICPSRARADETSTTSTFALVVTNNRSSRLSRPDLRYADDDGAKYYEMFRTLAPESNVVLLTTFDADTQKLFSDLEGKVKAPSRANVLAAARTLAERIQAAKARGPVDFYFVFAGHGDIDHGKGFLELDDGAFTSDDLHSLVRSIPATRSHVILDSCNAFFAIQARKPGGRHFVTSEEAQRSLAERLPDVGVFLSTSAEGNVYEWSSIQSGIFSHAVRSGMAGAADANGDGRVTYDELRAFVTIASSEVKNPAYRPQVFSRGPGGRGDAALIDQARMKGKRLRVSHEQERLTIRDAVDVPWFDFHKESGAGVTLVLPDRVSTGGAVERSSGSAARTRLPIVTEEANEEILVASLTESPTSTEARGGADEIFRSLFAVPFGPGAFAKFREADKNAPPFVLGVSPDERERMRLVLSESADAARGARQLRGGLILPLGLGLGAIGGVVIANSGSSNIRDAGQQVPAAISGGIVAAGGAALATVGIVNIFRPSKAERSYDAFSRSLALAPDTVAAQASYAEAERSLFDAAESDHIYRAWTRWVGFGLMMTGASTIGVTLATRPSDLNGFAMTIYSVPLVVGGAFFFDSLFPSTTERMAELWRNDPSFGRARSTSNLNVRPMFGPSGFGVEGTF